MGGCEFGAMGLGGCVVVGRGDCTAGRLCLCVSFSDWVSCCGGCGYVLGVSVDICGGGDSGCM